MFNKRILLSYEARIEMIRYLFAGGATTFVNWCVYGLLVRLSGYSITAGNIVAWAVAVIFAFAVNKIWVFESKSRGVFPLLREASLFLYARVLSGLAEIIGVPLLFRLGLNYPLFGIQGFAAKAAASIVVILLNYIFSKLIIFKRSEKNG